MVKNRRPEAIHDNNCDMSKIEYSLGEISGKIDSKLLNKLNRKMR